MRKTVQKLRERPEKERRHVLHLSTLFFAVIVLLLWTLSLKQSLGSAETHERLKQDLDPFIELRDGIVDSTDSELDS